ncbi:MAG: hypothetical protein ACE5IQ_06430 [Candidatus Methylomirabilales bacterium]
MVRRGRPILRTFLLIVAAMAVLAAYGGCYYLLVRPGPITLTMQGSTVIYEVRPRYVLGGSVAELIFRPAHLIDRQYRPEKWRGRKPLPPRSK